MAHCRAESMTLNNNHRNNINTHTENTKIPFGWWNLVFRYMKISVVLIHKTVTGVSVGV